MVDDDSIGNNKNTLEENFNMSTFNDEKITIIEPDVKFLINESILNGI